MAKDVELSDGCDRVRSIYAQVLLQCWGIIRVVFLQVDCVHLSAQSHTILDVVIYDEVEFFVGKAVVFC